MVEHTWKSVAAAVKYSPKLDFQAHLVYNAENSIIPNAKRMSLSQAEAYVTSLTGTRWWQNRTPKKNWEVQVWETSEEEHASASVASSLLLLPEWAREPVTIIHELSHIIMGNRSVAWHGPEFAWIECQVFKHFDPRRHRKLVKAFDVYGVKTKPPKFKIVR